MNIIINPSASMARAIENLVIKEKNSERIFTKGCCTVLARLVSTVAFPLILTLELLFKRIPALLFSITDKVEFNKNLDKVITFAMGILCSPLGLYCPVSVSGFFLQRMQQSSVLPFGVETQYGKRVDEIFYPRTVEELQSLVALATKQNKQISIIGSGMSQGTQTVPLDAQHIVINMKCFNQIQLSSDKNTVSVGSGATWEALQIALNKEGKSSIVKQASDPFSIGGSIAINCHGWAHAFGSIASTVESIQVIDAQGELKTLTPKDELFGCFFGTLGYFGIIVSATLKVVDNDPLIEHTEEIDPEQFSTFYQSKIKDSDVPLFGGRLSLDQLGKDPLQKICMVYYKKDEEAHAHLSAAPTPHFLCEADRGSRIQRIFLQLASHLSNYSAQWLLSSFWKRERQLMLAGRKVTRNEALHPPINAFNMLRHSNLHAQWLQEYFVTEENLPAFLRFLGSTLKENDVRLVNATIRPTPQDKISILPYAEQNRHAVVLCFAQQKTTKEIEKTRKWIEKVNAYLIAQKDVYYQAYMPYATREQFETCYGKTRVAAMRRLKMKYDPHHRFGSAHTAYYYGSLNDEAFASLRQESSRIYDAVFGYLAEMASKLKTLSAFRRS